MDAAAAVPLIDAALRGALLAVAGLLAASLWRARAAHVAARVGLALMVGTVVQTAAAVPAVEAGLPVAWQAPGIGVSLGNSVLFWLFIGALFDDGFALRWRHAVAWAAVVALGTGFGLSVAAFGPHAALTIALVTVMRWVPAVFALLALAGVAAQWRADLVERRRRLRGFILLAGVAYIGTMVALRLTSPHGRLSAPSAGFDTAALLTILAVVAVAVLRITDGGLLPAGADRAPAGEAGVAERPPMPSAAAPRAPAPPADAADDNLARALHQLMTRERAYRVDDLTVGLLALKLGVPEYRLRRHINQRLGHRNFNAYVNGLRLDEARAALADPARRDEPVLALALEAGFASIGPFNRAFKAATGLTPTEFRRQALADS